MKSFSVRSADRMGGQLDGDIAIAGQMQVGMMVLRLGNLADAGEEVKSGREILDAPFAADAFAVVAEPPVRHGPQVLAHLLRAEGGTPPSHAWQCCCVSSVAVTVMVGLLVGEQGASITLSF